MKKELFIAIITALIVFIVSTSIFGSIFNFTFIDAIKSYSILSLSLFVTISSSIVTYFEFEDYYIQNY